jgi:hypothetical protein
LVFNGDTKVSITSSHVFLPCLPELMSEAEPQQIQYGETKTQQTLATLEGIARRGSPSWPHSNVEMRELLPKLTSDETVTHWFTWMYALIILNVILS